MFYNNQDFDNDRPGVGMVLACIIGLLSGVTFAAGVTALLRVEKERRDNTHPAMAIRARLWRYYVHAGTAAGVVILSGATYNWLHPTNAFYYMAVISATLTYGAFKSFDERIMTKYGHDEWASEVDQEGWRVRRLYAIPDEHLDRWARVIPFMIVGTIILSVIFALQHKWQMIPAWIFMSMPVYYLMVQNRKRMVIILREERSDPSAPRPSRSRMSTGSVAQQHDHAEVSATMTVDLKAPTNVARRDAARRAKPGKRRRKR